VRWDRLGRMALLCVGVALLYLYMSAGLHMLSTWRESNRTHAQVAVMQREHKQLLAQHASLSKPGALEAEARQLGMMFPGEHVYIVPGLPNN
jgi:hypothetical protein